MAGVMGIILARLVQRSAMIVHMDLKRIRESHWLLSFCCIVVTVGLGGVRMT